MNKQQALQMVDEKQQLILDVNDRVWEYAETAFTEYQSMDKICEALEKEGFRTEKGVGKVPTAFTGTYGSGKPVIGILAEYDALSGINQTAYCAEKKPTSPEDAGKPGHGCGHNCLGAGSLAAAIAVKEYLKGTGKSGTVVYFGCPGEEGGSGKAFMAREGVFKGVDVAITWHSDSINSVMIGSYNANYQVEYTFRGVSSHAASDPHLGRSGLDALELMNVGVQFLREHMTDDARIHYAITNTGGYSPNVVQPIAQAVYLIRSPNVAAVQALYERVNDIAAGAALMTGTKLETRFIKACSDMINNYTLEHVLYDNLQQLPPPTYTAEEIAYAEKLIASIENPASGPSGMACEASKLAYDYVAEHQKPLNDFVVPYEEVTYTSRGSTDVGDVSRNCPTAQITTVCWPSGSPGHSWQIVSSCKSPIAHKGVLYAGKVMAGAIIDLLEKPELVAKAKAEFEKRTGGQPYQCPIPADVWPTALGSKM